MRKIAMKQSIAPVSVSFALLLTIAGCSGTLGLFNPSFVNTFQGGQFPVTPGPNAAFVLVRCVNSTDSVVTFFVTAERTQLALDNQGQPQRSESGEIITESVIESVELTTENIGRASEQGYLFECSRASVDRIGLGENLLPGDPAIFVIAPGAFDPTNPLGAQVGNGIEASSVGVNPLSLFRGDFNCGDTVIFRAFTSTGSAGGVRVETFLLPGSEQPFDVSRQTFLNYERFLESQVREDERP
jgi:hypothetical protein